MAKSLLPDSTWKAISPTLYALFWSLSLSDICFPKATYTDVIKREGKALEDLERGGGGFGERPRTSDRKAKRERADKAALIESLRKEQGSMEAQFKTTLALLKTHSKKFFEKSDAKTGPSPAYPSPSPYLYYQDYRMLCSSS